MELIISFVDQSESFTLGCEYGRLLERFEKGVSIVNNNGLPVHIKNMDVITRTCQRYGYTPFFGEKYHNEWVDFTAVKNGNSN